MPPAPLSDELLAGQRLMVGFDGTRFNRNLKFFIRELRVGGIILFARNLEGPEQIRELCASAQKHADACSLPPLLVAVDQEGGPVARLKPPFTRFAGNPAMKGESDAARFARITAGELLSVGINMNLAPVLDVAPEGFESIMAARMFGPDPNRAARLGATVIEQLQQRGVMAVAKHFPGIGRTTLDSHRDLPVLDADPTEMQAFELVPFRAAIRSRVAGVMLSHVLYPQLDPDWPASLSRKIGRDLLREQMGFEGLVLTDDLDMGAIERHYDPSTAIRRVLAADIDLALICHPGPKIEAAVEEIRRALSQDPGLRKRAQDCTRRLLAYKQRFLQPHLSKKQQLSRKNKGSGRGGI